MAAPALPPLIALQKRGHAVAARLGGDDAATVMELVGAIGRLSNHINRISCEAQEAMR